MSIVQAIIYQLGKLTNRLVSYQPLRVSHFGPYPVHEELEKLLEDRSKENYLKRVNKILDEVVENPKPSSEKIPDTEEPKSDSVT